MIGIVFMQKLFNCIFPSENHTHFFKNIFRFLVYNNKWWTSIEKKYHLNDWEQFFFFRSLNLLRNSFSKLSCFSETISGFYTRTFLIFFVYGIQHKPRKQWKNLNNIIIIYNFNNKSCKMFWIYEIKKLKRLV